MATGGVEQDTCADDVGVNEILRGIDAPIDVRFGGEIDDGVELFLVQQGVHLVPVGDVGLEKFVTFAMLLDDAVEIGQISGVGEGVNICDVRRLVMLQNVTNKVTPDEPTAARHQDAHRSAT